MARSERDVATAFVGRCESVSGSPPGYRFLLPTLPSDEEEPHLARGVPYPGSEGRCNCGRRPECKGGYCVIIDPCRNEIKVKIQWLPFHIPSETLRNALSEFGEVMEIRHQEWNVSEFESAESTTRGARMVFKEGVTAEGLPHLFKFYGNLILVVVPGRAPVCVRCRRRSHIRRYCQTPRCTKCRAFGHVREDCIRTYANVTGVASEDSDDKEDIMDVEEAETTAPDDRSREMQAFFSRHIQFRTEYRESTGRMRALISCLSILIFLALSCEETKNSTRNCTFEGHDIEDGSYKNLAQPLCEGPLHQRLNYSHSVSIVTK
ncbi:hypothetical protein V5799_003418 [Amblyomma americanum]|uniref:CCHC-type domain-containing protein n=1 Tax=Amblyomma americanum TaxID=6943 RepID=A0AAQ4D910_AMBAM